MTHTATEPHAEVNVQEAHVVTPSAAADSAIPGPESLAPAAAPRARRNGRSDQGVRPAQREGAARSDAKGNKTRPQARKVHPVLVRLFELYPKMFGARFLPLKLGVFEDLMALHSEEFKREDLKVALGLHARSTRYLEAVAAGEKRHDLHAEPVEDVAPEHVHHAMLEVFRRHQARTPDDLRPELRQRLVAAIEASSLSRQEYAERMRTSDEALNAVLDAACNEVAEKAAKREALQRAFAASGRTVAEFAEMYGMAPAEVSNALGQAEPAA